eukprot:CAMPEP_0185174310 /NCGR_PEP_ID=MMETSP1139-20130426/25028_1 /TAXON_ID=298111 /ORGANISM="Pavlova sp., Strain CCMP459" /LENGTH=56 /DNA_ID=CAMNT_0027740021 /DNA_START=150 /DNA_END=317 /DNA_ORIENTATION=-
MRGEVDRVHSVLQVPDCDGELVAVANGMLVEAVEGEHCVVAKGSHDHPPRVARGVA